jgi:hypothetical protein
MNGERRTPSGVPQLAESGPEIKEKIRRQHRLLGRMTYRNLCGSAAKPGPESPRIIGRNLPCEESGANAGQDVTRSTGRQARGTGRVVGHRLTRLADEGPRSFQEQRRGKFGREFSDDLDAAFAGRGP